MTVITTKKDFEEIVNALNNVNKIVIISCDSCAAICQTGGKEGAKEIAEKLEKKGIQIIISIITEEVCDNRVMKKEFFKIEEILRSTDAILTLSCGLGVASIIKVLANRYSQIPVFVGTNTEFMGITERIGRFYMRCKGCGDCLLNETGGICPITTCAKSLMNGPCGGMVNGKCEVGNYERDCGWVLIYNRLKEIGRLDSFSKLREPRNWSESGHQREVIFR